MQRPHEAPLDFGNAWICLQHAKSYLDYPNDAPNSGWDQHQQEYHQGPRAFIDFLQSVLFAVAIVAAFVVWRFF